MGYGKYDIFCLTFRLTIVIKSQMPHPSTLC